MRRSAKRPEHHHRPDPRIPQTRLDAAGRRVPHLRRGRGVHALLHGVPDRLHRGVRLDPRAKAPSPTRCRRLISGATSPLVGVLVDRLGPRRLVLIGGVLLAAGLVASSFANALWQVILLYGVVMTLGANCLGLVVFVPILSRRFVRNRGMAVAIVQSANGFARAFSAPVSQVLIARAGLARTPIWRRADSWRWHSCRSRRMFRRSEPERAATTSGPRHRQPTAGRCAGDAHAAFLAAVAGLCVHRSGQLPGGAAPARLRGHDGLRQALRGRGAGAGRIPVAAGRDHHRMDVRLCRARIVRGGHLRHVDHRRRLRDADYVAGPASAAVAAFLLLRADLGRTRAGDHRQDGRSVSRAATGHDPRGDHDRHGDRLGVRFVAGGVDLRCHRQLPGGVRLSIFFYACGSVAFWALRRPPAIR